MKKIWTVISTTLVVLGLVAATQTIALAGPGHMGGGHMGPGPMGGPGMMFAGLLRSAGLTPDQKTKVDAIMSEHRPVFRDLFHQLRAAEEDLATTLFTPGDLTTAGLTPQSSKILSLRQQLMNEGLKVALEVRSILTPDQLSKAADTQKQLRSLHQQMRALMGGGEETETE
jgi:Spy/CpxP family protein refolding chaperone